MPIYEIGNIWDEIDRSYAIFATTNSTINSRNELVMGRGFAREVKDRYPLVAGYAARIIKKIENPARYGIIYPICDISPLTNLGLFQVKYHWSEKANLDLIKYSSEMLAKLFTNEARVSLNFPGIGNGKLSEERVRKVIDFLPENFIVYKLSE